MKATLQVLAVGEPEAYNSMNDTLVESQRCRLAAAPTLNALYAISTEAPFNVAVLHSSLSAREMRDAGAFIRRNWPAARILAIAYSAEDLDTWAYDLWTTPDETLRVVVWLLERVAAEDRTLASSRAQTAKERGL